jgi:hypothetical protein
VGITFRRRSYHTADAQSIIVDAETGISKLAPMTQKHHTCIPRDSPPISTTTGNHPEPSRTVGNPATSHPRNPPQPVPPKSRRQVVVSRFGSIGRVVGWMVGGRSGEGRVWRVGRSLGTDVDGIGWRHQLTGSGLSPCIVSNRTSHKIGMTVSNPRKATSSSLRSRRTVWVRWRASTEVGRRGSGTGRGRSPWQSGANRMGRKNLAPPDI